MEDDPLAQALSDLDELTELASFQSSELGNLLDLQLQASPDQPTSSSSEPHLIDFLFSKEDLASTEDPSPVHPPPTSWGWQGADPTAAAVSSIHFLTIVRELQAFRIDLMARFDLLEGRMMGMQHQMIQVQDRLGRIERRLDAGKISGAEEVIDTTIWRSPKMAENDSGSEGDDDIADELALDLSNLAWNTPSVE